MDYTHPDLKDQVDHSQSASCVGGMLNTSRAAYMDTFGHGTCALCPAPPLLCQHRAMVCCKGEMWAWVTAVMIGVSKQALHLFPFTQ